MENSQNRDQVLKILFAQHPNEAGFFVTSDNQAFTEKHKSDGLNHAKTLEDKSLDWVENPKAKVKKEPVEDEGESEALIAKNKELFGKDSAKNIKTETLKTKIAEKEGEAEAEA